MTVTTHSCHRLSQDRVLEIEVDQSDTSVKLTLKEGGAVVVQHDLSHWD